MQEQFKNEIRGYVRVFTQKKDGSRELIFENHNQIQDDYATILPLLLAGDKAGQVNTLYLEYENVGAPEIDVTTSTFEKSEGCEHYTALSGNADFIRQALLIQPVAKPGSITFSALVGNETGYHGLTFGTGVHSRIYSMALVAAKNNDQTQDLVFARKNWPTTKIKSSDDIYIEWTISFST